MRAHIGRANDAASERARRRRGAGTRLNLLSIAGRNNKDFAMQRLPDRVALVTGAAGGLGRATALRLASEGARLCLLDRADVSAVKSEVEAVGSTAIVMMADVTDSSAIQAAVKQAAAHFGRIDALINVAGVSSHGSSDDVTEQEWNRVLSCNLTSVFLFCKAVLPIMRSQKYGRIVNVSSVLAQEWRQPAAVDRSGGAEAGRKPGLRRRQGRHARAHEFPGERKRASRHYGECGGAWPYRDAYDAKSSADVAQPHSSGAHGYAR